MYSNYQLNNRINYLQTQINDLQNDLGDYVPIVGDTTIYDNKTFAQPINGSLTTAISIDDLQTTITPSNIILNNTNNSNNYSNTLTPYDIEIVGDTPSKELRLTRNGLTIINNNILPIPTILTMTSTSITTDLWQLQPSLITINDTLSNQVILSATSLTSNNNLNIESGNDIIIQSVNDTTIQSSNQINLNAPNINSYNYTIPICFDFVEIDRNYNYISGGQNWELMIQQSLNVPYQFFTEIGYTSTKWKVDFSLNTWSSAGTNNDDKALAFYFDFQDQNNNVYQTYIFDKNKPFCNWYNTSNWSQGGSITQLSPHVWSDYVDFQALPGTGVGNVPLKFNLFISANNARQFDYSYQLCLTKVNLLP